MNKRIIAAVSSFVLILLALGINSLRREVFGIVSGYAPNELGYLVFVSVPLFILAFGFSFYVFLRGLKTSDIRKEGIKIKEVLTLILAFPGLVIGAFFIVVLCDIYFSR